MIASFPQPEPRDPYRYYGTGDSPYGYTATTAVTASQYAYVYVYAGSTSYAGVLPPPPTREEQRKDWSRQAVVAFAVDLRRHPPKVIERPRQLSHRRRSTRSVASRWRVLH